MHPPRPFLGFAFKSLVSRNGQAAAKVARPRLLRLLDQLSFWSMTLAGNRRALGDSWILMLTGLGVVGLMIYLRRLKESS